MAKQTTNRQNKSNTSANTFNSSHANNENKAAHRDTTHARDTHDKKNSGNIYDPTVPPVVEIPTDGNSSPNSKPTRQRDRPVNPTLKQDIYDPTLPDLSEDTDDLK